MATSTSSVLSSGRDSKRGTAAANNMEKSQKHFEQLRRYILGRNVQLEEIQDLIARDPSCVQQSDSHHGLLPLHWACVFQNPLSVVQCLLEAYPPAIDHVDSDGRTPLHHACRAEGRVELVEYLVERNRRVISIRDHRGKTPLHCACMEFVPTDIVRLLLEANPSAVKVRTRDGNTALHCACEYNAPMETIQILIDAYPEAVKYIREGNNDGKFGQAKQYLAYKVRQTEEQAKRAHAATPPPQPGQGDGGRKTPVNLTRYEEDHHHQQQQQSDNTQNTTSESDNMRRRLEEEERKIVAEEKELTRVAQQQQRLALQRLQEQEMDVEKQAAELDRLIQQKETHLDNVRFRKETERLFGKGGNRALNDSGIVRNRSYEKEVDENSSPPAPVFQKHHSRNNTPTPSGNNTTNNANPPITSTKPKPEQYMTPSALGESHGGVSAEVMMDEAVDDEVFGSLRKASTPQPLYPESKVSGSIGQQSRKPKGRDPSTDANDTFPTNRRYDDDGDGDEPSRIAPMLQETPNLLQDQLNQAMKMLEDAEERRQREVKEAQQQQTALQNELGKLMEKLEASEEQKRKQQIQWEDEKDHQQQKQKQQQQQRKQQEQEEQQKEEEEEAKRKQQQQQQQQQQQDQKRRQQHQQQQQPEPSTKGMRMPGTPISVAGVSSTDPFAAPTTKTKLPPVEGNFVLNTKGDNATLKDGNGCSPLHIACAHGASYTSLQFLLQQFPLAVYHTDDDGSLPLHHACSCSKTPLEVFQLLLDIFPAGCWMANRYGQLPLHQACQHHGHRVEILQLLMETARGVEAAVAEGGGDDADESSSLGGGGPPSSFKR